MPVKHFASQSTRCALVACALVACVLVVAWPAHAEEPASKTPPSAPPAKVAATASGDCAQAAVEAAAAKLSEDEVRVLVGLPIGKEREEETDNIMGGGGEVVSLVGAFRDPACFELLVVSCGNSLEPCGGPFTLFRLKGAAFHKSVEIELDGLGAQPQKPVDFNHDGQHEILADEMVPDTGGTEGEDGELTFDDSRYSEVFAIKGDKILTLWNSYTEDSLDDITADNVSFKDTNGDKIDELIVTVDGKETLFVFDGMTFKAKK
jgi:hypothetical protein